jgi:hypothetical protein
MIVRLLVIVAVWVVCEIVGEAIFEGLVWLARRTGILVWSQLVVGTMAGALAWWNADPASDLRTRVVCLAWLFLASAGLGVPLLAGLPERPADGLPRAGAGAGLLRNRRLRVR